MDVYLRQENFRSHINKLSDSKMDRQLQSPLLITRIGSTSTLTPAQTYTQLGTFLHTLPPSPARTQLERLTDALGVEIGLIAPSEGDRREAGRIAAKTAARSERRRLRKAARREEMGAAIEGVSGGEMEDGAVSFEGEKRMDEKGDVEYDDVSQREEDEDEPDNEDGKMDVEAKD